MCWWWWWWWWWWRECKFVAERAECPSHCAQSQPHCLTGARSPACAGHASHSIAPKTVTVGGCSAPHLIPDIVTRGPVGGDRWCFAFTPAPPPHLHLCPGSTDHTVCAERSAPGRSSRRSSSPTPPGMHWKGGRYPSLTPPGRPAYAQPLFP